MQDEPLGMTPFTEGENLDPDSGAFRAAPKATTTTGDKWQQTKEKATAARERTEFFLRENPVPTIIGATLCARHADHLGEMVAVVGHVHVVDGFGLVGLVGD